MDRFHSPLRLNVRTNEARKIVRDAAEIMIRRVYQTIPRMRYQMLRNELEYATAKDVCRRVLLRSTFDSVDHLTNEQYRCDFCDICVPDLDFKVQSARVPAVDQEAEDLARIIPDLLVGFDPERLRKAVKKAEKFGAVTGVYMRVATHLERDATNLAALFLAGVLGVKMQKRRRTGLNHLRFGYQESRRQGLDPEHVNVFLQEGMKIDPEEAFGWYESNFEDIWNPLVVDDLMKVAEENLGEKHEVSKALCAMKVLLETRGAVAEFVDVFAEPAQRLEEELKKTLEIVNGIQDI